jgi:CheY-like chemotaxis protein
MDWPQRLADEVIEHVALGLVHCSGRRTSSGSRAEPPNLLPSPGRFGGRPAVRGGASLRRGPRFDLAPCRHLWAELNLDIIGTKGKVCDGRGLIMRALVVDDNDTFRTLVATLLAEFADVVEQAADGDVALHLALDMRPELIVMDITMPRMDGISAARAILRVHSNARIIFLSGTETAQKLSEASTYGVVIDKDVNDLRAELHAAAASLAG